MRQEVLELLEVILDLLRAHAPPGLPVNEPVVQQLIGRLLPCYNASLEPGDKALLRGLHLLDSLLPGPRGDESPLAVLHGALSTTGCV